MVNFNGELLEKENGLLSIDNRGFKYGDALFETIKIINGKPCFLEDHYFRLMASMRMIRMEIPMDFTLEYFEEQVISLFSYYEFNSVSKVRFTVFRKNGGLYLPKQNTIDFVVEAFVGKTEVKEHYSIDIFKDHYVNSGLLSTLKSSNRLLNVLSSIYADENELDNCILLNEAKNVVEASNANVFVIKDKVIATPKLLDGCIKGIARKKIIELLQKQTDYTFEERSISPFELQKADEVFLSNAIVGVQPVTHYKKKQFSTEIGLFIAEEWNQLVNA